jgi:hypothetical protein
VRARVLLSGSDPHWGSYGELRHALRTGRASVGRALGVPFFRHLERDRRAGAVFDEVMAAGSAPVAREVATAFDFSRARSVVDVGGGRGGFLLPLLEAHPRLRGVLLDGPRAVRAARASATRGSLRRRLRLAAGDFFRSVPAGGDVYVLRNVLHDWDDGRALRILLACRRAMSADSVLLVVERVLPSSNRDWLGAVTDLDLLVLTGGRARTRGEHRELCREAGLSVRGFVPTPSGATVLLAVRARAGSAFGRRSGSRPGPREHRVAAT